MAKISADEYFSCVGYMYLKHESLNHAFKKIYLFVLTSFVQRDIDVCCTWTVRIHVKAMSMPCSLLFCTRIILSTTSKVVRIKVNNVKTMWIIVVEMENTAQLQKMQQNCLGHFRPYQLSQVSQTFSAEFIMCHFVHILYTTHIEVSRMVIGFHKVCVVRSPAVPQHHPQFCVAFSTPSCSIHVILTNSISKYCKTYQLTIEISYAADQSFRFVC